MKGYVDSVLEVKTGSLVVWLKTEELRRCFILQTLCKGWGLI